MSVIIPTLDRPVDLAETIATVRRCRPVPLELIVVDGNPAGGTKRVVADLRTRTTPRLLHVPSEHGLTRQRNVGLTAATGDVVVFFDDDVEVAPDVIGLVAAAYRDPAVVGATGRVVEPAAHQVLDKEASLRRFLPGGGREGTFTRYGYPRRLLDASTSAVEFMPGCFMSARRDVALEIGFDEDLPGYGLAEDEDFSYRLSRRGTIRYLPGAVVVHKNTGFSTRDRRAFNRQLATNRLYLFRKNFRQTRLARAQFGLLGAMLVAHRLLNRDFDGVRGLVEGFRAARRKS